MANVVQLSQTPVVDGESTVVTLPGINASGGVVYYKFIVPCGKAATLPKDIAYTKDLAEFISGRFAMAPTDLPVFAMHWDTPNDRLVAMLGDKSNTRYTQILAQTSGGTYKTHRGHIVPEVADTLPVLEQNITVTNATDNQWVAFPIAYNNDDVKLQITGGFGNGPLTLVGYSTKNKSGCNLRLGDNGITVEIRVTGNVG